LTLATSTALFAPRRDRNVAGISFRDWLGQGESIYVDAMKEFQTLEAQIEQLEIRLVDKKHEVNQIAQMIGKPIIEGNKRLAAELVDRREMGNGPVGGAVSRALTGRPMVAR
jgi:hypothetical protein